MFKPQLLRPNHYFDSNYLQWFSGRISFHCFITYVQNWKKNIYNLIWFSYHLFVYPEMSSKINRRHKLDDGVAAKRPRECSPATKITELNDDCLLEIFDYLSFKDLYAVKASHHRFAWSVNRVCNRSFLTDNYRTKLGNVHEDSADYIDNILYCASFLVPTLLTSLKNRV